MKRNLALLLALVMVISMFAGCSSPAPEEPTTGDEPAQETPADEPQAEEPAAEEVEQVLVWNIGSEPKTIDPALNTALDGGDVINNLFEGLMREVGGELQPAMAESYTVSDDGLVYTFTMRDNVLWSDGEPVTAYDFEYAWDRVLDPETASEYSWIFGEANIDSFQAIDEKTFEVTLKVPTPYFLGLTAFFTFMPVREDAVAQGPDGAWAINPEVHISNGPFVLESYQGGDRLVMAKNENYWRADEVKLDQVVGLMIVDITTAFTAYQAGEIDFIDVVPPEEIPKLMAEDPTFAIFPADATYYYAFNVEVEPLGDINVRKALNLAIDRTAIVEQVLKGGQLPAMNVVSPASRDANNDVFAYEAGTFGIPADGSGIAEAQELLAEAGYPNGEGFPTLELLYNTSESHKAVAEAVQEMWKQNLNIDVTLGNQEWAVFQDTRRQHDFEIARVGWFGDYSDPMTYLGMFRTDAEMNVGQWEDSRYDELLDASTTAKGQERFDLLYEANEILMNDYPIVPIYYYIDEIMISDAVKGWEKGTRNTNFFGFAEMVE